MGRRSLIAVKTSKLFCKSELLDNLPAAPARILPEFGELHFWILIVEGADSRVESDSGYGSSGFLGRNGATLLSSHGCLLCRRLWLAHKGNVACKPAQLTLREYGISGDASDIIVQCLACSSDRRMSDAFDQDVAQFKCPGHHPHLRRIDNKPCDEVAKSILLGASNSWSSVSLSALSIPLATDRLAKIVEEQWGELKSVQSQEELQFFRKMLQKFASLVPLFSDFKDLEIWDAIEAKRLGSVQDEASLPYATTAEPPALNRVLGEGSRFVRSCALA